MVEKTLDKIMDEISGEEKKIFEEHMKYRSLQSQREMRTKLFEKQEGGTEKIFDEVYHHVYKEAKNIKGKTDQKSITDALELIVLTSLEKLGVAEKHAATLFKATKDAKQFKDDNERIGHLQTLLRDYLGVDPSRSEAWAKLMAGLKVGDPLLWNESVRTFTDYLKDSIIDVYIDKHKQKTITPGREYKFTAYAITEHLGKRYGLEPEKLGISLLEGPDVMLNKLDVLEKERHPSKYKQLGIKEKEYNRREYKKAA